MPDEGEGKALLIPVGVNIVRKYFRKKE